MNTNVIWHIDPGHAWLQVSIEDLVNSGVAHLMTKYSYIKGAYAYLEEDCDAIKYLNATKTDRSKITRKIYEFDAPIRDYDRFPVVGGAL